jgi:CheY-like chemotaxis protein
MLNAFGILTDSFRDPKSLLDALTHSETHRNRAYDLMLIDWRMPGKDGIALQADLRDLLGDRLPPVIMTTAYGREELEESLIAAGMSVKSILTKPVSPVDLRGAIASVLGNPNQDADTGRDKTLEDTNKETLALRDAYVLLVEDNELNQELAVDLLRGHGLRVDIAGDGARALELVSKNDYDGVLMDCQMPVMDGYEATARIRALSGPASRVPIVAVTANAMADDRRRCLAAGMDDYVSKPIASATLAQLLGRHLGVPIAATTRPPPLMEGDPDTARAASGPAVFDPSVLAALPMVADGSQPEFAEEMRVLFADSAGRLMQAVEQALAEQDKPALLRSLHTLKSSSAQVGALQLSALVTGYEASLRAGAAIGEDWQVRLREAWSRLEQAWLAPQPAGGVGTGGQE